MVKRVLSLVLSIVMSLGLWGFSVSASETAFKAGTYTATSPGLQGPLTVEVTVSDTEILSIKVIDDVETPGLRDWPLRDIPAAIVENQSLAVDVITGATYTSRAILRGVETCLKEAGGDLEKLNAKLPVEKEDDLEMTADVVIVGGGGGGLVTALTALREGATVILIEKTGTLGGNSIMAGGFYNAAYPDWQSKLTMSDATKQNIIDNCSREPASEAHKELMDAVMSDLKAFEDANSEGLFDSANWHALQTWESGDRVGDLAIVRQMCEKALDGLQWYESMGLNVIRVAQGSGALYERSLYNDMPNGTAYIKALTDGLEGQEGYTQLINTVGNELITDGDKVVGVLATGKTGNKITLHANNGVVLATGGFAGNVELRQKYCEGEKWPDLGPDLKTTNVPGVTGDGIFMAEAVGAQLVNMEQIQLLQTCNPFTGMLNDNCLPMSVAGFVFVNKNGERFVREDGRRDVISLAILDQPDQMAFVVQSADSVGDPDVAKTLDGRPLSYMLENKLSGFVSAETLDEIAEIIGVPTDAMKATLDSYNAHVESQEPDEFGRTLLRVKLENGPWYAYPRKPAAHHTMGGVRVDLETHALRADGSIIKGLYCVGELTGVVHGANRVGGNALVDFTVHGRIAGENAAAGK